MEESVSMEKMLSADEEDLRETGPDEELEVGVEV